MSREAQVDEIDSLMAIFGEDAVEVDNPEVFAAVSSAPAAAAAQPPIRVLLRAAAGDDPDTAALLTVTLPPEYPDVPPLVATRPLWDRGGRADAKLLNARIAEAAEAAAGQCVLYDLVVLLQELLDERVADEQAQLAERAALERRPAASQPRLIRRLLWSHHIKSPTKRKYIVQWSAELGLGGFCKPGYPGVIIVEGEADAVEHYTRELFRLRWKAITTRAETTVEAAPGESIDDLRVFEHHEVIELGETDLGVLGEHCEKAGIRELFLAAMKLS